MHPGLVGAMIGGFFGIVGGVIGTYFSIKNTKGPRERALMVRCAVYTWVAVISFVTLLLVLPMPYNFLLWIPYGIALPLAIRLINKRQMEIRAMESRS
jgi:hypothetical protein